MEFKYLAALFLGVIAIVVLAISQEAEAGVDDWWAVNDSICDASSKVQSKSYSCKGCCKARGYDKATSGWNKCTCYKKGSSKTRDSDELREYHGFLGKLGKHSTHEDADLSARYVGSY